MWGEGGLDGGFCVDLWGWGGVLGVSVSGMWWGEDGRTFTLPPVATPRAPFWLQSRMALPPLAFHVLTAPFQFRQSHTLTLPSTPAEAKYLPAFEGSTLNEVTPPK